MGLFGDIVDAASDAVGGAVDAVDDYVFDTVDYVTGGAVDIDFDGGDFSFGAGFPGVVHFGASVGEHGLDARGEVPGADMHVGINGDGFSAGGSAGIKWGPLPYVDGHVDVSADGDVSVGGYVQGTIPTPVGMLSGHASGGFMSNDDGWGGYIEADGTLRTPAGVTFGGGVSASYVETEDGSHTSVGAHGEVSGYGMEAGGSAAYERIEKGDDVIETFEAEGHVDALGVSLDAEADYVHAKVDGVEMSDWSGDVSLDGDVTGVATAIGSAAADEFDVGLPDVAAPVDDFTADMNVANEIETSLDVDQMFEDM